MINLQTTIAKSTDPLLVLITGASGSGKTSLLKALQQYFSTNLVSSHHFDDIGIPSIEQMVATYGSTNQWQEWATHAWIKKLAKLTDKNLIFLEGSFNPEFAVVAIRALGIKNFILVCLHADKIVRKKRLTKERKQPELVTQDMENFAQFLKAKTFELGGTVLDSNDHKPSAIAQELAHIIVSKLPSYFADKIPSFV